MEAAAAAWPGTIPAYGLHPWYAGKTSGDDWRDALEEKLLATLGAWLGEAGLDGLKTELSPLTVQERAFREQLALAVRLDRPVNLHCVKTWEPLQNALDDVYLRGGARDFVVHSFAGPHQFVASLAERGAYFTVGPLFSRRDRARSAVIPEDRLLLESDAFLVPGRDAAADLGHALEWLAKARGCAAKDMAERIAANSRRIFHHG